jgi:hypothetical protein
MTEREAETSLIAWNSGSASTSVIAPGRIGWSAFSAAERRAANAAVAIAGDVDERALAAVLQAVVAYLLGAEEDIEDPDGLELGVAVGQAMAFQGAVDLSQPFAAADHEISASVLGALAEAFATSARGEFARGFVSTPPLLAFDMVAAAAFYWLQGRVEVPRTELRDHLWGIRCSSAAQVIADELAEASWYDPGVGGGVFPLCVLLLLNRVGVPLTPEVCARVTGLDISRVAVEASSQRLWLLVAGLRGIQWERAREEFVWDIGTDDALSLHTEQLSASESARRQGFDLVVGNPPYVRAAHLTAARRQVLRDLYPTMAGGFVDLYQYFIANGVQALAPGGCLCFVSPAGFQRSESGLKTRELLDRAGSVEAVFDFDELQVFENASLHSSVYVFRRNPNLANDVDTFEFSELPAFQPLLQGLVGSKPRSPRHFGRKGWVVDDHGSLVEELEAASVPLDEVVSGIYSGIKTGLNSVYIVNPDEAKELLADELSAIFLRPVTVPVRIRAWRTDWDGRYMIVPHPGVPIPAASRLMKRLSDVRELLEQRSDLRPGSEWYELRSCAYFDLFDAPKIVFPDIATSPRFAMDLDCRLISDGAFMLPGEDYFLLGVLNSSFAALYFRARCNRIGNPARRGRLRFKKTYVRSFPVPIKSRDLPVGARIAAIARELSCSTGKQVALERQLDEAVAESYGLSLMDLAKVA